MFQPIKPSEFDLQLQNMNNIGAPATVTQVSSSTEIGKQYLNNLAVSGKSAQSGSTKAFMKKHLHKVDKDEKTMDQIMQDGAASHEELPAYHQPDDNDMLNGNAQQ